MQSIVTYSSCPLCFSSHFDVIFSCKDYTVSQETYDILECSNCSLRFTQGIPTEKFIGKYYQSHDYISHSDSDRGFVNVLYKAARSYTIGRKRHFLMQQTGKLTGQVLDVGSGTGAFLNEMRDNGWQVTGLEPDAGARQKAKALYGIEANVPDELFNLPTNYYDVITMWHVLEHVHRLHENIEQFKKLLKPDGKIVIAVPNYTSKDGAHYGPFWAAYDVPRHLYHFSPKAMEKLNGQHNLVLRKIVPMWLDGFYISLLSEKYKTGRNRLLAGFWQGLKTMVALFSNVKASSSLVYVLEKKQTA